MTQPPGWSGVFAYLVTPIDTKGRINEPVLRSLVDHLVESGIAGFTPLGGTGEYPLVDPDDRVRVDEIVVDQTAGRVPVVAGVGGFTSRHVIMEMERMRQVGVDGYLCILQGYYALTTAQLIGTYERIASASDLPIAVYHNPSQTHITLSDEVIAAFGDIEHLDYVKDASGKASNLVAWTRFPNGPAIFSATASSLTAAMATGAVGWMGGPPTALPEECTVLYQLCVEGQWKQAARLERALTPLLNAFRRFGQVPTIKTALQARGWDVGGPLEPLTPPQPRERAWIIAQLEAAEHAAKEVLADGPASPAPHEVDAGR